ncbi:MAG: hypothetical protein H0U70_06720 [Tatlockia sp.]|nr:hypothetical protein [Tatlockia sp.]
MSKLLAFINSKSYFIFIFISLLALILNRITLGIDLGDESYYASFLDGWLKDGIKNSNNLMIHQTAALLLFPFAYAYQAVVGSETGLILYLRLIYTLMSFGAMLTLYYFLKPIQGKLFSTVVFAFGVLFIPWGLPAPSYNTIGMFGMLAAVSVFGIAVMQGQGKKKLKFFFSASLWTCSIVAYPSLLIAFVGFILIAYAFLKEGKALLTYLILSSFIFTCTLALLFLILGTEHIIYIFKFSNSMLQVSSLPLKIYKIIQVFHNSTFLILCLTSLIIGGSLPFYPRLIFLAELYIASLSVYLTFYAQPSLFLASHDLIFIIALLGIFIPLNAIRSSLNPTYRLISIMYCTSFFAGLITTITASNGLFNFPVGGLLAACLTLGFLSNSFVAQKRTHTYIGVMIFTSFCMAIISFSYFYGEIYGDPLQVPNQKIKKGIFAGLTTSQLQANFINKIISILPQNRSNGKIAVFGRLSGLYLLTSLSPAVLSTWNYNIGQNKAVLNLIRNFYQKKKNQPDLIIKYKDPWGEPLAEIEKLILQKYEVKDRYKAEIQSVTIYQHSKQYFANRNNS